MKKIISFLSIVLLSALFMLPIQAQTSKKTSGTKLEIYYFHSTNRCVTCNAVESNAKALLQESFKSQADKGNIKFASINIDDKANKALVEKYQISYSTLLIIKSNGKKTDFTNTAFQYAKNNPTKYKELLKAEINKNLK